MKQFDYEKIIQPDTVIHCDTEEKANELLKFMDNQGFTWLTGHSLIFENEWKTNSILTYYEFDNDDNSTCYGNIVDFNYCKILKYEEVVLEDKWLGFLSNGKELIRKADGSLRILDKKIEKEKLWFKKINDDLYQVTINAPGKVTDNIFKGNIRLNKTYNKYIFESYHQILLPENLTEISNFLERLNNETTK